MFDGVPLVSLSAPAILGITMLLILTGRLLPRSTYQEKVAEAERWRQAYEREREARAISDSQTRELLELARVNKSFLTAVFDRSEEVKQAGASDANQKA